MFKKTRKLSLKTLTKAMVMTAILGGNAFVYAAPGNIAPNTLPTGEHNMSGVGSVNRVEPVKPDDRWVMNIEQNANANVANISWNTFNVGSNATVNVKQFNTNQTLVNTVVGNNMSEIYGRINATGNVVLINPKGAVFGNGAQINVGGLSVYAASGTADGSGFTPDPNQKLQGKITVEGNAQINVGPGYALYAMQQMKNLGIKDFDESNFVMGAPSYDSNVGKLRLVAAGDVELKKGTIETETGETVEVAPRLVAIGHLSDDGTRAKGEEEFIVGGEGSGSGNAIILRADVDADDFGNISIDKEVQGNGKLDVYYNPEFVIEEGEVVHGVTDDGVLYNKKNYKKEQSFSMTPVTLDPSKEDSADWYGVTKGKWAGTAGQTAEQIDLAGGIKKADTPEPSGDNLNAYMLVNNIAQLQDIEDVDYGNLKGKYVLGRTVDGKNDNTTLIVDGILYRQITNKDGSTYIGIANDTGSFEADANNNYTKKIDLTGEGETVAKNKAGNYEVTSKTGVVISENPTDPNYNVIEWHDDITYVKDGNTVTASKEVPAEGEDKITLTYTGGEGFDAGTKKYTKVDATNQEITGGTGSGFISLVIKDVILEEEKPAVKCVVKTINAEEDPIIEEYNETKPGPLLQEYNDITSKFALISNNYGTYKDALNTAVAEIGKVEKNMNEDKKLPGTTNANTWNKDGQDPDSKGFNPIGTKNTEDTNKIKVVEAQIDEIEAEIGNINTEIGKIADIGKAIEALEDQIQKNDARISQIDIEIKQATEQAEIKKLQGEKANLQEANVGLGKQKTDLINEKTDKEKTVLPKLEADKKKLQEDEKDLVVLKDKLGPWANQDFSGKFIGYDGLKTNTVNNLVINRPDEDNVGLFATTTGTITRTRVVNPEIKGHVNVGGFAGVNEGSITWGGVSGSGINGTKEAKSGFVKGVENVGGVAGLATGGKANITSMTNTATIIGKFEGYDFYNPTDEDPKDIDEHHEKENFKSSRVGGIVGYAENVTMANVHNQGNIFGEDNVGGMVGQMDKGDIKGTNFDPSYNNGQVTGDKNVGGLIGLLTEAEGKVTIENAFNTNENGPLSTNSQIWVDEAGKIYNVGGSYVNTVAIQQNSYYDQEKKEIVTLPEGETVHREIDIEGKLTGKYFIYQGSSKIYVTPISILFDDNGKEINSFTIGGEVPVKGVNYTVVTRFNKPCLMDIEGKNFIVYTDAEGEHYVFEKAAYEFKPGKKTTSDGEYISSDAALSKYGQVTGKENVGGLVGEMDAGNIYESYNAGNVTGDKNVGGLVGQMNGGEVKSAYNADNNTVIREYQEAPKEVREQDPVPYKVGEVWQYYQYSTQETEYNSFFTVDASGNRTYYWFLPNNGATVRGAAGVYVKADDPSTVVDVDATISKADRYYFNRVAYKDANVKGSENVGGLVGEMTSGTVDNSYNAGTVKNSVAEAKNHGALVGNFKKTLTGDTGEKELPTITDSFFVSGKNEGIIVGPAATNNGKPYAGVDKPFGNDTTAAIPSGIDNVDKWVIGDKASVYSGSFTTMSDSDTLMALSNGKNEWMGKVDNTSKDNIRDKEGAHTWLTYEYTTLPLLYDLMIDETLQRVFEYDGSTHNLKTIDVDDLYGMANFEEYHAGRDVITQGYELNEEKTNSVYHYNSTNMWAPQHSYRTKSNATLEVTTHGVDVTVTGERLYGQHNLLGYFVYVPAYGIEEAKFYFVTAAQDPVEGIDKGKYVNFADIEKESLTPEQRELIEAALVDLNLDNEFYKQTNAAALFKDAVNKNGSYLVTIGNVDESNTLVAGETVDAVLQGFLEKKDTEQKGMDFFDTAVDLQKNKVGSYDITNVQGIDNTGKNYFYAKSTQPAVAKEVYYKAADGKYYTHINPEDGKKYDDQEFEVDVYTSGNYTLKYNGTLTIDKANLYYTYDGIKTYGDTSNTITAGSKITIVGKDDNSEAESVNGYLKDWDLSNTALKKVGDQYTIDLTKNDGLKNSASKTVLAVVEGKTAVAKQDKDNNNLLYYTIDSTNLYINNLTGKVYNYDLDNHKIGTEYDVTKDTSLIQKVINPGGNTNVSDRIYHVKGSKESPEKYQVLWTEIAPASNGKLSDNYNFVFVGEGEHQTTYTKSATKEGVTKYEYRDKVEVTKGEGEAAKEYDDYLYTQSKTIKAAASTQLINPKELEVTIIGQRDYGTNMITTEYKTNGTTSLLDNYWYVNTNTTNKELKKWDELDNVSILGIISGIETNVDSTTKISQYTNSRSSEEGNKGYDLKDPGETKDPINDRTYFDSKVDVTKTKEGTKTSIVLKDINADDYIVSNGNHNLTIDPSELIIKIKGEKIYGEANQTAGTDYEYHIEGLKPGGKIGVLENNAKDVDWQTRDDIKFTINSDHLRDTDYDAKNNTHLINLDADLGNFDGEGVSIKEGAEYQYDISKGRYLNAKEDAYKKQGYNDRTENGGLFINDITNVGGFISTNYDIKYYTEYTVHQRGVNIDTTADRVYGDQVTVDNVKINNNDYAYDVEVRKQIQTNPEKWTTTGVTQLDNYFLRDRDLTKVVNKDYFATIDNSDAWLDVRYDTNKKVIGYGFTDDYDFIKKIVTEDWIQTDFKNDEETPELKNLTTNYKMNSKGNDTLTITPAYLQISITGSKVYGEKTIGLDVTEGSGAPLTYTYYTSTDGENYKEGMLAGDETTLNAGKYVVNVSQLKDNDIPSFNTGKYLDVGTYNGQVTIQPVPDPVPPEGGANAANLLASTTAGNVYTNQAIEVKNWDDLSIAGTDGIDIVNKKIIVQKGFNQNNFKTIETDSTYEVTPRPMTLTIDGHKTYGEDTTDSGLSGHTVDDAGVVTDQDYKYKVTGLANGETFAGLNNDEAAKTASEIEHNASKKLTDGEAGALGKGIYLNAGTYSINGKGVEVTNWDKLNNFKAATDTGFKDSNYAITYAGDYVVDKRKVAVDTEAQRVYGYKYDTIDTTKGGKVTYTADNHFAGLPGEKYTGFVAGDGSEKLKLEEMLTTKDVSSAYLDVKYNADNSYAAYVDTQTDLQTGSINNITTDFKTTGVSNNYETVSVNEKLTITPAYMKVTVTGSKTYGEKTAGLDGTAGIGSALNYKFETGLTADKITDTARVGDQFSKTGANAVTIDTSRLTDDDAAPYNQGVYLDETTSRQSSYAGGYKGTTSVNGLTGEITVTNAGASAQTLMLAAEETQAPATSKAILLTNLKEISVTDEVSGIGDEGFNLKNYYVVYTDSDYDVNPANLSVDIKGQKTYGDATDNSGSSTQFKDKDGNVQVTFSGLKNQEEISEAIKQQLTFDVSKLEDGDAEAYNKDTYLNADTYTSGDGNGITITNWSDDTLRDADVGFKASNYILGTTTSEYKVDAKEISAYIEAERVYGENTTNQGGANEYKDVTFGKDGALTLANTEKVTQNTLTFDVSNLKDGDAEAYNKDTYLDADVYTSEKGQKVTINNWKNVKGTDGFLASNYILNVDESSSKYTVKQKEINYDIKGERYYGEETTTQGGAHEYIGTGTIGDLGVTIGNDAAHGLANTETINESSVKFNTSLLIDGDVAPYNSGTYLDAGIYYNDANAITFADWDSVTGNDGFKSKNYKIADTGNTSTYKVMKAVVDAIVIGEKTYGDATSQTFEVKPGSQYTSITFNAIEGAVSDEELKNNLDLTNSAGQFEWVGVYSDIETDPGTKPAVISKVGSGIKEDYAKNYELRNLNSTYTINKRDAVITSTATNTYGEELADGAVAYDYNNFVNGDQNLIDKTVLDGYMKYDDTDPKGLGSVAKNFNTYDVNTYGTQGAAASKATVLKLSDNKADIEAKVKNNYNITFEDKLTINPRNVTIYIEGSKEYSTGAEHTIWIDKDGNPIPGYSQTHNNIAQLVDGITPWDTEKFDGVIATNTTNRATPVDTYTGKKEDITVSSGDTFTIGKLIVDLSNVDEQTRKNYNIDIETLSKVTKAILDYYGIDKEIYIGQPVPDVPGTVINKFGEEVSDLIGANWPTDGRVDNLKEGKYPVQPLSDDKMGGTADWEFNSDPTKTIPSNVIVKVNPRDPETGSNSPGQAQHNRRQMISIQYLNLVGNGVEVDENAVTLTSANEAIANDATGIYSGEADKREDEEQKKKKLAQKEQAEKAAAKK